MSKKLILAFGNFMGAGGQNKIIVLEADRTRRDTLRSLLADGGHLTFSFDDDKNCLDNLLAISPDLVVARSFSNQEGDRFVNSLMWMNADLPLLIISDDLSLNEFVEAVGFTKIGILKENYNTVKFRQEISRLLNDETPTDTPNGSKSPLIVGEPGDGQDPTDDSGPWPISGSCLHPGRVGMR